MRKETLYIKDLSVSFGQKVVLKNITLRLYQGEMTALLGLNGAGKTTLLKTIAGIVRRDEGEVYVNGDPAGLSDIRNAQEQGIIYIPNDGGYIFELSEMENVFLDNDHHFLLRPLQERKLYRTLLKEAGIRTRTETDRRASKVGQGKLLRLLGVLKKRPAILLIDEPLAFLDEGQKQTFYELLACFLKNRTSILVSTHDLEFVQEWADRCYILGDSGITWYLDHPGAIREFYTSLINSHDRMDRDEKVSTDEKEKVLAVEGLRGNTGKPVSFELYRGEIAGLVGGNAFQRRELLSIIAGVREQVKGEIFLSGCSPAHARSAKYRKKIITYISEERNSLIDTMSVEENIVLGRMKRSSYFGIVDRRLLKYLAAYYLRLVLGSGDGRGEDDISELLACPLEETSFGIRTAVKIAQGLCREDKILLMESPTLGMDEKTKENFTLLLRWLSSEGRTCLLISNENEDLYFCDRFIKLTM